MLKSTSDAVATICSCGTWIGWAVGVSDIRSHHRGVEQTPQFNLFSQIDTIRTKTRLLKVVMVRSGMKGASC